MLTYDTIVLIDYINLPNKLCAHFIERKDRVRIIHNATVRLNRDKIFMCIFSPYPISCYDPNQKLEPIEQIVASGALNLFKWAIKQYAFTGRIVSIAAKMGHLHIMKWLYSVSHFDIYTFDNAIYSGNLHLVKWLYTVYPNLFTTLNIDRAIHTSNYLWHTDVAKWLQCL